MTLLLPTTLILACLGAGVPALQGQSEPAQSPAAPSQSLNSGSATTSPGSNDAGAKTAAVPLDQQNAMQAKAYLEQAIQALGGTAYLNVHNLQETGRAYSFFHGRPTSDGILFWRFVEYPDKERFELTQQRDIAELYVGDKGTEITYKGPHPVEKKALEDYLRHRKFALDTVLRTWLNDPKVALFYDGMAIAAEHQAVQITLINGQNESVTIYLDSETHLPLKTSYIWRDPVDRQKNEEDEIFGDYRNVQGIMTAYNFTRLFNGDMSASRFVNTASYNQRLDEAMFDPNSGYNPMKNEKRKGKH